MKEAFFKTAQTTSKVWDIEAGSFVAVQYQFHQFNSVSKKDEAVYLIKAHSQEPWRGHVFSRALDNFCL
jgi:Na+-transporting NADH:ubiquinone oxidoreductase subunit NqrF